jgi:hypothetical protein
MKTSLLIILFICLAIVVGAAGYYFGINKLQSGDICVSCPVEQQVVVDTKTDQQQVIEKDTILEPTDEMAISLILADKHQNSINNTHITISERQGNHIFGTVCFGEVDEYGRRDCGGIWATKAGGVWQILADGNGAVSCYSLDEWGYPRELSHGCTDQF